MLSKNLSIITINYNNCGGLKKTINSVIEQDYYDYQYVIIDGNSSDGSVELISGFNKYITKWISEDDMGIYHAMNKAVDIAEGEWLLFMNSGDTFYNRSSLRSAMLIADNCVDVIYSDWTYLRSGAKICADKEKMNVRHQSVIYKKSLHDVYGLYIVSPNLTISDYIFFCSISSVKWVYNNAPLSICDEGGVSSKSSHFYQRIATDYLFSRCNKFKLIFIYMFHPIYHKLKKYLV